MKKDVSHVSMRVKKGKTLQPKSIREKRSFLLILSLSTLFTLLINIYFQNHLKNSTQSSKSNNDLSTPAYQVTSSGNPDDLLHPLETVNDGVYKNHTHGLSIKVPAYFVKTEGLNSDNRNGSQVYWFTSAEMDVTSKGKLEDHPDDIIMTLTIRNKDDTFFKTQMEDLVDELLMLNIGELHATTIAEGHIIRKKIFSANQHAVDVVTTYIGNDLYSFENFKILNIVDYHFRPENFVFQASFYTDKFRAQISWASSNRETVYKRQTDFVEMVKSIELHQ